MRRIPRPLGIKNLYLKRKMSVKAIALRFGVCHSVAYRWLKDIGVMRRYRVSLTREEARRLYTEEKLSDSQIADKFGISRSAVKVRLRGVPRRRLSSGTFKNDFDKSLKKYGITESDYKRLLKKQKGVCRICSNPPSKTGRCSNRLHIDHKDRKVRGLLCGNCNTGIGLFRDNPELLEKAIQYLKDNQ